MGYISFTVTTESGSREFHLYHKARDYRLSIEKGSLTFIGYNIFLHLWDLLFPIDDLFDMEFRPGVRCFFSRLEGNRYL